LESRLLEIAREYPGYGRVDYLNRWSPELCSLRPSNARMSVSSDEAGHGRKIYFLLAKNRDAYVQARLKPQPAGQVVVKEAWEPKEVAGIPAYPEQLSSDKAGPYIPFLTRDKRHYTTGARSGLFMMLKEGSEWSYGTVSADGHRVLQFGRLESCLECHREAQPDSVFGLPKERQEE
jgi:hypothetical protein